MSQDLIRTKAIILRRTDFGEFDRILQVATTEGVFGVLAKGVRKEKSKLAGAIEFFSVSDVVLAKGRGTLYGLRSARLDKFYGKILNDYDTMNICYEILRSAQINSSDSESGEWFECLRTVFDSIDLGVDAGLIYVWWLIQLSEITGNDLNLERDIEGKELLADLKYRYDALECGLTVDKLGKISANHIKILRLMKFNNPSKISKISGIEKYIEDCRDLVQKMS